MAGLAGTARMGLGALANIMLRSQQHTNASEDPSKSWRRTWWLHLASYVPPARKVLSCPADVGVAPSHWRRKQPLAAAPAIRALCSPRCASSHA